MLFPGPAPPEPARPRQFFHNDNICGTGQGPCRTATAPIRRCRSPGPSARRYSCRSAPCRSPDRGSRRPGSQPRGCIRPRRNTGQASSGYPVSACRYSGFRPVVTLPRRKCNAFFCAAFAPRSVFARGRLSSRRRLVSCRPSDSGGAGWVPERAAGQARLPSPQSQPPSFAGRGFACARFVQNMRKARGYPFRARWSSASASACTSASRPRNPPGHQT